MERVVKMAVTTKTVLSQPVEVYQVGDISL